ncbi:hypothetical protein GJV26_23510 [Massilia dura]|uniref:WD40 repeat domain-containing protein n=1 Tax=Pseudoduganella dura TaxID=321982 RepID=A0A6I3XSF3_9BURK|nr:WD40 repeat domain-containing protein [Pseudoduganella dura]MUI15398.1 hypothetical protein [Pseudoduganella dura]
MHKHVRSLPGIAAAAVGIAFVGTSLLRAAPAATAVTEVARFGMPYPVDALAFHPDGRQLAAASYAPAGKAQVWDWRDEKKTAIAFDNNGNGSVPAAGAIGYSPDGRLFAWCGNGERVWDAASGMVVFERNMSGGALCAGTRFAPDGRTLVHAAVSPGERVTDVTARDALTGAIAWRVTNHDFVAGDMALSADGGRLAVAGLWHGEGETRQQVRLFDMADRALLRTIEPLPAQPRGVARPGPSIARVAWSPDGTRVAVGLRDISDDGAPALKIFDARTGDLLDEEAGRRGTHVRGICFSPDGRYLVILGIGRRTRVWDGQHTRLIQEIRADPAACAMSADSRHLALGGAARGLGSLNPLLGLIIPNNGKVRVYELP